MSKTFFKLPKNSDIDILGFLKNPRFRQQKPGVFEKHQDIDAAPGGVQYIFVPCLRDKIINLLGPYEDSCDVID